MSFKAGITVALLFCLLMPGIIVPAQARDSCDARVRKAEDNLRKETRKHGEHSAQAQYRRRQLEEARETCGFNRGYFRARKPHRDKPHDDKKRGRDHDKGKDHDRDRDRAVFES